MHKIYVMLCLLVIPVDYIHILQGFFIGAGAIQL